jgi:hypothetical protein
VSAPYTVTAGPAPGAKKPKAEGFRIELDPSAPIESLGLFLSLHQGRDAWWACATYTNDYRENENWQNQIALSVDLDHHDALGQHAPLSDEARKLLEEALPTAPGTWSHLTPSGARVIALLDQPIVDASVYPRVWGAFIERVRAWCPSLTVGELRVDTACKDLARFYYTPRATAKGVKRDNDLVAGLAPATSLAQLLAEAPKVEPPKPKESKKSNGIHHVDKYSRARAWLDKADPAIQGNKGSNEAIKTVERVVRGFELTEEEALDILTAWNARCQPPWSLKELKHKISDGLKKGDTPMGELLNAEPPPKTTNGVHSHTNGASASFPTDPNARIFERGDHVELAASMLTDLRGKNEVVFDDGSLYRYERDGLWLEIEKPQQSRIIQSFAGSIVGKSHLKLKSSDIDGAIKLASHQASRTGFFADAPAGLAFKNGFVQVTSIGISLHPHAPDNRCRYGYEFDYTESTPQSLLKFLDDVWVDDPDKSQKIELFQEFGGMSMVGRGTSFQKCIVALGKTVPTKGQKNGSNGKSQAAALLAGAMPKDSTTSVAPHTFEDQYRRAKLAGKRLNFVGELPEADILETQSFKAIVGGDQIEGRRIYEPPFDFKPQAAHFYSTNMMPGTNDITYAFFRRFIILTFNRTFIEGAADHVPDIADKILASERPDRKSVV